MTRFALSAVLVVASAALAAQTPQRLPSEPMKQFGSSVTGSFEGWYDNPDGSHTFLVGYLNRNFARAVDIPIGPNNHIEPGGPDMGQPVHFLPGRQFGMFTITVPKEFSAQQRLTWSLTINGEQTSIPLRLHNDYVISPFTDIAVGNTPPIIKLAESGPAIQGPLATTGKAPSMTARAGEPLTLNLWVEDDAKYTSGTNAPLLKPLPPVTLVWSKYRGPGEVTFEKASPSVEKTTGGNAAFTGKAVTTATFSEAGDYMLHVTANDFSGPGGGGEVCCWSTAIVKVVVSPK